MTCGELCHALWSLAEAFVVLMWASIVIDLAATARECFKRWRARDK